MAFKTRAGGFCLYSCGSPAVVAALGGYNRPETLANAMMPNAQCDDAQCPCTNLSTYCYISGDGISDLIVGAPNAGSNGDNAGKAYVVFGKADGTPVNLSDVASGTGGFAMIGETAGDGAGMSVNAVGDVSGDGIGDLIVSAIGADPNGSNSGKSYVVFGKADSGTVNRARRGSRHWRVCHQW
ncbi:integrin alpha [Kamptonema formosum]|uniref:integrin alpha n=1 Tax=Kamptonema formosum TaxID=331992 RepID=UPI00034CFC5C|nr:integrin alpha [Oscillatoria sp. PCC 10802]